MQGLFFESNRKTASYFILHDNTQLQNTDNKAYNSYVGVPSFENRELPNNEEIFGIEGITSYQKQKN